MQYEKLENRDGATTRAHKWQILKATPPGTGTKTLDFGKVIQLDGRTEKKGRSRIHVRSGEPIRSPLESDIVWGIKC
jgi:hypothetical protein